MVANFKEKCNTRALEGAHLSPRGGAKAKADGAPTRIPKGARKDLRSAARGEKAPPEGQPSSSAQRSTSAGSASGMWDEANWEEPPRRTSDPWSKNRGDHWDSTSGINGQNVPIGTDQKEKDLTIQKGKVVLKEVTTHTKDLRSEQRSRLLHVRHPSSCFWVADSIQ